MATNDELQFEIERRAIIFKSTTTMPDGTALGYDDDPNIAVAASSAGEFLLVNSPIGTSYIQDDGTNWNKEETGDNVVWVLSGGGGESIPNFMYNELTGHLEASVPIQTTLNSFFLGGQHKMSSGGENVFFTNLTSTINWYPLWGGVRDQSVPLNQGTDGVIAPSARVYSEDLFSENFGALPHASINITYEVTYTPTAESVHGVEVVLGQDVNVGDVIVYEIHNVDLNGTVVYKQIDTITVAMLEGDTYTLWFDHPHEQHADEVKFAEFHITDDTTNVESRLLVRCQSASITSAYVLIHFRSFVDKGIWWPQLDDNSNGMRMDTRDSSNRNNYTIYSLGEDCLVLGSEGTCNRTSGMRDFNTVLGIDSAFYMGGDRNTFVGGKAGYFTQVGASWANDSVVVGYKALGGGGGAMGTTFSTILGTEAMGNIEGSTVEAIAIGYKAGVNQDNANRTIAIGREALGNAGSTADYTIAIGYMAGRNMQGNDNVTIGSHSMLDPLNCDDNVAIGHDAFRGKASTSDRNVAVGHDVMLGRGASDSKSGIYDNVAIGTGALKYPVTGDDRNIAIGESAMNRVTATLAAKYNICMGYYSGAKLSNGEYNVFIGDNTGGECVTGKYNVGIGTNALSDSVQGYNTAVGAYSISEGSNARYSAALGFESGQFSYGYYNTFLGYRAGKYMNSGGKNVAVGWGALINGEASVNNTCIGFSAGKGLKESSSGNIAIGYLSLSNINDIQWFGDNIAIGSESMLDAQGQGNICIGTKAGAVVPSNYSVMIGHYAGADQNLNDKGFNVYIGYNAGIRAGGVSNGGQVIIGSYAAEDCFQDRVVYVGYRAGRLNQGGNYTTAMGYEAHASSGTSVSNGTFIGYRAGYNVVDNTNTAIGSLSMGSGSGAGTDNTCLGYRSGYKISTGYDNVYIGKDAGESLTSGHDNIVIGADADLSSSGIDYTCQLGGSQIIWLRCNDQSINTLSDRRDKTDIIDNPFGLDYINELKTRQFKWDYREGHTKKGKIPAKQGMTEVGFIAQELKETQDKFGGDSLHSYQHHPSEEGSNDYHAMDLMEASQGRLLPVAIKAIQELSKKLDDALARIEVLENK